MIDLNSHYKCMGIEPLEVMRGLLTYEEYIGFLKGNVIKYSMRQGTKMGNSIEKDAAKARAYIELLKEANQDDDNSAKRYHPHPWPYIAGSLQQPQQQQSPCSCQSDD